MRRIILIIILLFSVGLFSQKENTEQILKFQNLFGKDSKEGISCYRIPSIVTATNGDLIAAIDERVPSCGDLNRSKDINIVIRRSTDNGKTWSEIETVVDFPFGRSASDPSMIVDRITGDIFLFFNYMDHNKEKNIYYLYVVKSSDHGRTWEKPVDITSQITKPEWYKDFKFITSGRGIQTGKGKLLHTLVNLDHGLHLFASDDHGRSWYLIDTPVKPANESKVVELEDGSWMINSRVQGKGIRYSHISSDEGKTWISKPEPVLIDPGCNASIIHYTAKKDGFKKNRLLFSNINHPKKRKNITLKISYDEGKTWTKGKTIYPGLSAYSSLTVLENGDIGLFFEKDGYHENVFVRLSLDWLTNGKDSIERSTEKTVKKAR